MVVAIGGHGIVNCLQQLGSVARKKIYSGHAALLQSSIWIKRIAENLGVPADHFAASQLGRRSSLAQPVKLILHFRSAGLASINERWIEFGQRHLQRGERIRN